MIKFLKRQLKNRRYRLMIKNYFEPREEFLRKTKALFIQKLVQQNATRHSFYHLPLNQVFKYGFAGIFSLLLLGSGAVVFADKQNVGYSHPLYPLKRLGETFQIKLAPTETKSALRNEFAHRRLVEIKEIKLKKQDLENKSQIVLELKKDMNDEVNLVVEEVQIKKIANINTLGGLCQSLSKIMDEDEQVLSEQPKLEHEEEWSGFQKNCHEFMER